MSIEYYLFNPCGNMTALVTSQVSVCDYADICRKIMGEDERIEQVGFVKFLKSEVFLHMSGGEFCGNATMCAAVLYAMLNNTAGDIWVRVYGCENPIKTKVSISDNGYACEGDFDEPLNCQMIDFTSGSTTVRLPIVHLSSISHIIAPYSFDEKMAVDIIREYSKILNLPSLGIMLYDELSDKVKPIVYVKEIDTLFYEKSCGSGSVALGSYLLKNEGDCKSLYEPGGIVSVKKGKDTVKISEIILFEEKRSIVF